VFAWASACVAVSNSLLEQLLGDRPGSPLLGDLLRVRVPQRNRQREAEGRPRLGVFLLPSGLNPQLRPLLADGELQPAFGDIVFALGEVNERTLHQLRTLLRRRNSLGSRKTGFEAQLQLRRHPEQLAKPQLCALCATTRHHEVGLVTNPRQRERASFELRQCLGCRQPRRNLFEVRQSLHEFRQQADAESRSGEASPGGIEAVEHIRFGSTRLDQRLDVLRFGERLLQARATRDRQRLRDVGTGEPVVLPHVLQHVEERTTELGVVPEPRELRGCFGHRRLRSDRLQRRVEEQCHVARFFQRQAVADVEPVDCGVVLPKRLGKRSDKLGVRNAVGEQPRVCLEIDRSRCVGLATSCEKGGQSRPTDRMHESRRA
jgi:hypothetical protein